MNRSTTALLSSLPSIVMNQSSSAFSRVKNSSGSGGFVCETADSQTSMHANAASNIFFIFAFNPRADVPDLPPNPQVSQNPGADPRCRESAHAAQRRASAAGYSDTASSSMPRQAERMRPALLVNRGPHELELYQPADTRSTVQRF